MPSQTTTAARTSIGGGEILSTGQLRAEAARAEAVLEEFTRLIHMIGAWANGLPDRYVEAPFGTDNLSTAVNHVTEANGEASAISEAITEMLTALDEADSLGETVAGIEADGAVGAFTQ